MIKLTHNRITETFRHHEINHISNQTTNESITLETVSLINIVTIGLPKLLDIMKSTTSLIKPQMKALPSKL